MKPLRILLLGELSGVHEQLAPALRALGHNVTVGHSRLATPGFASDIPFFRPPPGVGGSSAIVRDIASQLYHAPRLTGFDVVQLITPKFFNWKIHGPMMRFLKRNNRKLVAIATSCSSDYHRRVQQLAYRPCEQCLAFDLKSDRCIYDRPDERAAEHLTFDLADAIVATHYEYAFPLADTRFADKVVGIPLPIDTRRHRPTPMPPTDKVRIWYGETRHGFKGSAFILPALEELQAGPLGGDIEIIRTGRVNFGDYLELLDTVHIVIDQASSYGMGMHALYALAHGRVVLSGAEPEAIDFIGVSEGDNPIVNIRPDPAQIAEAVRRLVLAKATLPGLGRRSADYAARYHDAAVVAAQYERLYQGPLNPTVAPRSARTNRTEDSVPSGTGHRQ